MTNEPPIRLQIQRLTEESGRTVLKLSGEIDLETAGQLDTALDMLAAEDPDSASLVDLSGIEFIDSTGLGVILHAQTKAESRGHALSFRRGGLQVQRLFDLTGIGDRLTFEN